MDDANDRLAQATRALRDIEPDASRDADTRRRVLTSLGARQRHRRRWMAAALVTGLFGVSSAAALGGLNEHGPAATLRRWLDGTEESPEGASVPARETTVDLEAPAPPSPEPTPEGPRSPAEELRTEELRTEEREAEAGDRRPSMPARSEESRLYEQAHRLHFQEEDPRRALRAWNAYLRHAPRGRFVPEARYNRAILLLRLRRFDQGERALAPFVRGAYGGYRQEEATRLMQAIPALRAR